MREATDLPVSTSEQIMDYSAAELRGGAFSFLAPNIHGVDRFADPHDAVAFVVRMATELRRRSSAPLLIHESGWCSSGLRRVHTPEAQRLFWSEMLKAAHRERFPIVVFEAYSQDWKREPLRGADIGPHWGLFTAERRPKPAAELLKADRVTEGMP
jgi:exo-beta-1,3-glucanase (GH17 family)